MRSLHLFKGESSFTTWLYRIETNCFLDMRKKAKSRPSVSLDEMSQSSEGQLEIQIADDRPNAQQHVEKGERMSTIKTAMDRLPLHQRAILMMYHAEAMSYEDIAETLRLPIGTVKSRLNRARLGLRDLLLPRANLFVQSNSKQRAMTAF